MPRNRKGGFSACMGKSKILLLHVFATGGRDGGRNQASSVISGKYQLSNSF